MPPSLQDQGVWLWHHRLYWWLSLVPLVWAPIAFGYGEETMQRATLAYWGAWLPAFLLRRRFPRLSLGAHLGVAVGTALYTLVLFPQGGSGRWWGRGGGSPWPPSWPWGSTPWGLTWGGQGAGWGF
jgi:hypothetical protein